MSLKSKSMSSCPVVAAALALALPACGDTTASTGDAGLLRFALVTNYEVPEGDLRDARIVAGHLQRLDVELTDEGEERIEAPGQISYRVDGAGTVESEGSGDDVPDLSLLVEDAGSVRVQAIADGEEVDGIDLTFEAIASLELVVKVRAPWAEEFEEVDGTSATEVVEGAHATFLAVPLGPTRERLAGDFETEVSADPAWSVVPGEDVGELYEDGSWGGGAATDFYFIEPATTTVTLTETAGGAAGEHAFVVAPLTKP